MRAAELVPMRSKRPTLMLTLPARAENVAVIRQALAGVAKELGASPGLIDDIKTAVSEAATNVVVHAYTDGETGPMEIRAFAVGRRLEVAVRDRGVGMQPRPVSLEESSLRVGLALIGAMASQVEIRGEKGEGTEVRLTFDIDREGQPVEPLDHPPRELTGEETLIAVNNAEPGGAAIPNVLELLAARSDIDLDRLSDTQLIGDFLSHWSAAATVDSKPLELAVSEGPGAIEIRIGPLEKGIAELMLKRGELPGYGNTLERIADRTEVVAAETAEGPAEFLVLEIARKPS